MKARSILSESSVSMHDYSSETQFRKVIRNFEEPFGKFVVDIDVGGTFTDAIISRKNLVQYLKVDTTPDDLSQCLQGVIEKAVRTLSIPDLRTFLGQIHIIRLSTSLSTNTLVERKGARLGLLLTKGWRTRYLTQPMAIRASSPLVFEDMVLEIDADVDSKYHRQAPVSEDEVREKAYSLLEKGATIIVISLNGAETCPANERQVKAIINKYYPKHFISSVPVVLGSQISNGSDYLRRTNTALLNAYCHGAIALQLFQIEDFLRDAGYAFPLLIIHSSGGSARVAKTKSIQTISSGAAAGIFGSRMLSTSYGGPSIISVDVGGTSTEIGLLRHGVIDYSAPAHVEGLPVDVSLPVASTLGIGGGSIARIDRTGKLSLGPKSTGAFPGPVCYNLGGTEPTLTDAYLILGYFDENYFLGGEKLIQKGITQKIFTEKIAMPLGISCEEAAFMVKRKAVEFTGEIIRTVISPTDLAHSEVSLFAIGGGGGCIGADLSDFVGIGETYVFRQGSVFGAFGSSNMDIMHIYERRVDFPLFSKSASPDEICHRLNSTSLFLQRMAFKDISGEGFRPEEIRFELEIELNTVTSSTPVRVALPAPFIWPSQDWPSIQERVSNTFGGETKIASGNEAYVSRLFLWAIVDIPHSSLEPAPKIAASTNSYKGKRPMYVGHGRWVEAEVYEWDLLSVPCMTVGPSMIESQDTTIVVPPGKTIKFYKNFNGVIKTEEKVK